MADGVILYIFYVGLSNIIISFILISTTTNVVLLYGDYNKPYGILFYLRTVLLYQVTNGFDRNTNRESNRNRKKVVETGQYLSEEY